MCIPVPNECNDFPFVYIVHSYHCLITSPSYWRVVSIIYVVYLEHAARVQCAGAEAYRCARGVPNPYLSRWGTEKYLWKLRVTVRDLLDERKVGNCPLMKSLNHPLELPATSFFFLTFGRYLLFVRW